MRIWRPDWLDSARAGWYLTPGPVAQLVEQRTFNPTVRGSSPRGLTEKCMENKRLPTSYPVGGEAFLASGLLGNFVDRIGSLVRNRRERIFLVTRSILWRRPSDRTESRWLFPIRHRRAFRILSSVGDSLAPLAGNAMLGAPAEWPVPCAVIRAPFDGAGAERHLPEVRLATIWSEAG